MCACVCVCQWSVKRSNPWYCQLPQDGGATKGEASFRRPERIRATEPEDMRQDSECGCGVSCTIGSRCLGTGRKSCRDLVGETKACRLRAFQLINSPRPWVRVSHSFWPDVFFGTNCFEKREPVARHLRPPHPCLSEEISGWKTQKQKHQRMG